MSITGSIRDLKLNNISFVVSADSDFDRKPENTKESQATSGRPNIKITKQNPDVDSVDIIADGTDREIILDLNREIVPFNINYTDASGTAQTGIGWINITADNTQDGKITIMLIPQDPWTAIVV